MFEKGACLDSIKTHRWSLAVAVLIFVFFFPVYSRLIERFSVADSYYSHGFLIPFISLYLVWRKRTFLATLTPQVSYVGFLILFIAVIMHIAGLLLQVNFISYLALPLAILGAVLYLSGATITKAVLFPIVFLVFMLPLPQVMIIGISFKLKLFVAHAAAIVGNHIGIETHQVGSTLYYPGGKLLVGDPCSGLRSLISFLALGALFTQFTNSSRLKKITLFVSAVPVALASNLIRIVLLLLVSYVYGERVALGFFHDFSGYLVFVVGFLGMIGAGKLLRCTFEI